MKTLAKIFSLFFIAISLSGCVGKVVKDIERDIQDVRKGPREMPIKNITDFSDGLRCMDNMFEVFRYSPNEFIILIEEIADKTKKVDAGAREMLISALSDMTRRSQAIQVIAYGAEATNLVSFLDQAEQKGAYANIPPFDIIGSVTQLDKDIVRKQADAGFQAEGSVNGTDMGGGFGVSASNSASLLGVDLSVVTTHNIAVIPGVTTRNTAVIYRTGSAADFDAGISKTGITYSVSGNKTDGTATALRALIELSAIELIGKLAKMPYWVCLGLDPEHEEIKHEISDWFYQLSRSNAIHQVTQVQLYLRGYYKGPIDGLPSAEYEKAIMAYKQRLGLPVTPGVDVMFYQAFLNDSPNKIELSKLAYLKGKNPGELGEKEKLTSRDAERNDAKSASKKARPVKTIATVDKHESLSVQINSPEPTHELGSELALSIDSSVDGYVSCYLKSRNTFAKIFPNRFSSDGFISNKGEINLPDSPAYSIVADKDGEVIHCFLVTSKVYTDLPDELKRRDFQVLSIVSAAELTKAYKKATSGRYAHATYTIKVN